jgi:hypothetical protein
MLGYVVLAVMGVSLVAAAYGWLMAHVRQAPASIVPTVGPIERSYDADGRTLRIAVESQIPRVRGARVARSDAHSLLVNVRPSIGRLDDAMGLFVQILIVDLGAGSSSYRLTGRAKSGVAIQRSTAVALQSFERELRMGMKRDQGVRAVLGDEAPAVVTRSASVDGGPPPTAC